MRLVARQLGEPVDADLRGEGRTAAFHALVEAFEETAVEERDAAEEAFKGGAIAEEFCMAPEVMDHVIVALVPVGLLDKTAGGGSGGRVHPRVERGEEEVLKDGQVVGAGGGRGVVEEFADARLVDNSSGRSVSPVPGWFSPAGTSKKQAGEQPDERQGGLALGVERGVLRKARLPTGPEIPIGHLAVEALGEQLGGNGVAPGVVEVGERADVALAGAGDGGSEKSSRMAR